jgi:hypothetical protein
MNIQTQDFLEAQRVDETMLARTATKILILSSCILLFAPFFWPSRSLTDQVLCLIANV